MVHNFVRERRQLLPVFIFLAAIYSCFWFGYSFYIKSQVQKNIDSLNHSQKMANLVYSSISLSGFPFKYNIEINNPQFTMLPVERLPFVEKQVDKLFIKPEKITISGFPLINNISIKLLGKSDISISTPEKEMSMRLSAASPFTFDYKFKELFLDPNVKKIADSTLKTSIHADGVELIDQDSKTKFYTAKSLNFTLLNNAPNDNKKLDFNISLLAKDSQFYPAYDDIEDSLFIEDGKVRLEMASSMYGLGNYEMDLNLSSFYKNNSEGNFILGKTNLEISKFKTSNELEKYDGSGTVSIDLANMTSPIPPFSVKWQIDFANTDKKYNKMTEHMHHLQTELSDLGAALYISNDGNTQDISLPSMGDIFRAIVRLGDKINLTVPMVYKENTPGHMEADLQYSNRDNNNLISINRFKYNYGPYSGEVSGSVNAILSDALVLSGNLKISINNYKKLVDDLSNYAENILLILRESDPRYYSFKIKHEFAENIKLFLSEISDYPKLDSNDVIITIKSDKKDNNLKIGRITFEEALVKYNDRIASYLKRDKSSQLDSMQQNKTIQNEPEDNSNQDNSSSPVKSYFHQRYGKSANSSKSDVYLTSQQISTILKIRNALSDEQLYQIYSKNTNPDLEGDVSQKQRIMIFRDMVTTYKQSLNDGKIRQENIIPNEEINLITNTLEYYYGRIANK